MRVGDFRTYADERGTKRSGKSTSRTVKVASSSFISLEPVSRLRTEVRLRGFPKEGVLFAPLSDRPTLDGVFFTECSGLSLEVTFHFEASLTGRMEPEKVSGPGAKSLRRNNLFLFIGAWISVSLLFAIVQQTTEADPAKPALFVLYSYAIHFGIWALCIPLLAAIVRRFPLQRGKMFRHSSVLLPSCLALALCVSLTYLSVVYFIWFPLRPRYPNLPSVLRHGVELFLQMDLLTCVLIVTSLHAWNWLQAYRSEQLRSAELEGRLANSQLNALRMQLHPHFLFNTLNSIAGLIKEDPETARRMIVALGDFLRLTLEEQSVATRPLNEELEFIQLYVQIEKMRFGERLQVEYEIDPDTPRALVPYLILQPLVENAIRHGVARTARPAIISLRTDRLNGNLRIFLENDGPKREGSLQRGVGINNTIERLQLHYGKAFLFTLQDRLSGGCLAEVRIPFQTVS